MSHYNFGVRKNTCSHHEDIGGQERFGKLTRTYYKGAAAAILVFDVTRHNTFESITKWKADIDSKVMLQDGSPVPCILVANKIDLNNPAITTKQAHDYCRQNQFAGFFETSVKLSMGILESIEFLLDILVDKEFASLLIETGDFVVIDSNDVGSVKMEDLMQMKKKRTCSSCSSISSL